MVEESDNFNVFGEGDEIDESFQQPVLFVPSIEKDEDLSAVPMDGTEFLKRVVEERKKIDGVVVKRVEVKSKKNCGNHIPHFSDDKCDPEFRMDKETQLHLLSEFSKLRWMYEARRKRISQHKFERISRILPRKRDEQDWAKLLTNTPQGLEEALGTSYTSIELCLAISQSKINTVMEYIRDGLSNGEMNVPLVCLWTYTLMASAHLPLDPDLCATLREITRTLISKRAQLESLASEELPHINLVICLTGRYFNQLDLADPID